MVNIVIIIFGLIICGIHIYKYGIEDVYDIDFLIISTLFIVMFFYNLFV